MVKNKETNKKRPAKSESQDEPIAKRLRHSTRTSLGNMLELFINSPGLQHIAEKIFQNLDKKSLLKLRLVNSSWKRILDRPMFWYRILKTDGITRTQKTKPDLNPPRNPTFKTQNFHYFSFLASIIQNLDPDDYEVQKNHALRMIKLSILETRKSENFVVVKKIMEENKPGSALKKKQKNAIGNQISTTEKILKLINSLKNKEEAGKSCRCLK